MRVSPLQNLALVAAGEAVGRVIPLVAVPFLLRQVGPSSYGALSYLSALAGFGLLFSTFGMTTVAMRTVARDRASGAQLLGILTASRGLAGIIIACVVTAIAVRGGTSVATAALYAATIPVSALDASWALVALQRPAYLPLANLLGQALYLGIILTFVRHPSDIAFVALGYFVIAAVGSSISLSIAIRLLGRPRLPSFQAVRSTLREAVPLGLASLMSLTYDRVDVVVLHALRGPADTGVYAAAYSLMNLSIAVLPLAAQVLFPIMARDFDRDPNAARLTLQRYITHMLATASFVLPIVVINARSLLYLFGGPHVVSGTLALQILAVNFIAGGLASAFAGFVLLPSGRGRAYLISVTIGAALNLGLNLALVSRFGPPASAAATVFAQFSVAGAAYLFAGREFNPFAGVRMLRLTLTAGCVASTCLLIPGGLVFKVLASGIAFTAAALALGVVDVRLLLRQLKVV